MPYEIRNADSEYDATTLSRQLGIPALILVLLVLFAVLIFEGRLRRMAHAAAVRRAGPRPAGAEGYPAGPGYASMPGLHAVYQGGTAYAPIISFVPMQMYPRPTRRAIRPSSTPSPTIRRPTRPRSPVRTLRPPSGTSPRSPSTTGPRRPSTTRPRRPPAPSRRGSPPRRTRARSPRILRSRTRPREPRPRTGSPRTRASPAGGPTDPAAPETWFVPRPHDGPQGPGDLPIGPPQGPGGFPAGPSQRFGDFPAGPPQGPGDFPAGPPQGPGDFPAGPPQGPGGPRPAVPVTR
nr:hypothetical protein GCM10020093_060960 [Planobispora longispora]